MTITVITQEMQAKGIKPYIIYNFRKDLRQNVYAGVEGGGYAFFQNTQGQITGHALVKQAGKSTKQKITENMRQDEDTAFVPSLLGQKYE